MNTTFETVVVESLLLVAFAVSIGLVAFILYIFAGLGIEFIKWIISYLKSRKNGNK